MKSSRRAEAKRGVGVDFSSEMLWIAKGKYPHLEFHKEDIINLEYRSQVFDFLILADVVGHLQDIEETLRGLRDFCHPETRIIISHQEILFVEGSSQDWTEAEIVKIMIISRPTGDSLGTWIPLGILILFLGL